MKTIFIPIQSRQIARNILRTNVLTSLCRDRTITVVAFVASQKVEAYRREFASYENLIFEDVTLPVPFISRLDRLFNRLSLFYIDTGSARFLRKQWLLLERGEPVRYVVSLFLLIVLGNSALVQRICRSLDLRLVFDDRFDRYFKTYHPDIVFTPRVDAALDRSLLRHAKQRGVKTVGMVNSWDNITLSKYPFRILPDTLIVHNEVVKTEAIRHLNVLESHIKVSGLPHFDHYCNSQRSSREAFCKRVGIDPSKKIILFAAIGNALFPHERQVLSMLDQAVGDGRLPHDMVILFRLHPTETTAINPSQYSAAVCFDDSKTMLRGADSASYTEVLRNDMEHLADSLVHTEMTVTTVSTMSIDAAAFDKPSINIAFDGWEKRLFHESARRFYTKHHTHYQPIVKSGGVRIAYSLNELVEHINAYLRDNSLDRKGRARIVHEQCYKQDGKAGERVARFVLEQLE